MMKQKRTSINAPIFNLKSALSTSLSLIQKLTSPSIVTTIPPNFLLIKKINDNNNNSIDIKNLQE